MCHLVFRAGELVGGNMSLCVLDLCGQGGVTLILCSIYKSKYHRSPNRTSSPFPYFNLFVSIFIQSNVNIKLHMPTLKRGVVGPCHERLCFLHLKKGYDFGTKRLVNYYIYYYYYYSLGCVTSCLEQEN
jgi:hypothetical protein